jgi:hypothetical protein
MTTHAPGLDVNEAHFQQWVEELHITLSPQIQGQLAGLMRITTPEGEEGPVKTGYCCLGLGSTLVKGISIERHEGDYAYDELDEGDLAAHTTFYFGETQATDLAPFEFIRWLMPDFKGEKGAAFDLVPDWPEEIGLTQGVKGFDANGPIGIGHTRRDTATVSAAGMNDDNLTFAQIGDVFRYFGIGSVTES